MLRPILCLLRLGQWLLSVKGVTLVLNLLDVRVVTVPRREVQVNLLRLLWSIPYLVVMPLVATFTLQVTVTPLLRKMDGPTVGPQFTTGITSTSLALLVSTRLVLLRWTWLVVAVMVR